MRHWADKTIYNIQIRLVGGAYCDQGMYGRPPFNNAQQCKNWMDEHGSLPTLLLSQWVDLLHEMPPVT